MSSAANEKTSSYYDYMLDFYRFWFVRTDASALHYGFSGTGVHSFNESLLNTNRYLSRKARMQASDKVLDAGCGIGGSALWLAEQIGCRVTGITISKRQQQKARELAQKRGLTHKVDFLVADYTHTSFPDSSFDVVWALESVCHAEDKLAFMREAYRLLKPGGRLVVADGYSFRRPKNGAEKKLLQQFQDGFSVPPLIEPGVFQDLLRRAKFENIRSWNATDKVRHSSRRMYYLCLPSFAVAKLLEWLRITSPTLTKNNRAGIAQYRCVKRGLGGYFVFVAEKQ